MKPSRMERFLASRWFVPAMVATVVLVLVNYALYLQSTVSVLRHRFGWNRFTVFEGLVLLVLTATTAMSVALTIRMLRGEYQLRRQRREILAMVEAARREQQRQTVFLLTRDYDRGRGDAGDRP